jgi:hypothetical protein
MSAAKINLSWAGALTAKKTHHKTVKANDFDLTRLKANWSRIEFIYQQFSGNCRDAARVSSQLRNCVSHVWAEKGRAGSPLPAVGYWQRNQRHSSVLRRAEDCPPYHPRPTLCPLRSRPPRDSNDWELVIENWLLVI